MVGTSAWKTAHAGASANAPKFGNAKCRAMKCLYESREPSEDKVPGGLPSSQASTAGRACSGTCSCQRTEQETAADCRRVAFDRVDRRSLPRRKSRAEGAFGEILIRNSGSDG